MILIDTAERNNGLCMPCKNGYRKSIEKSKEYYKKERELEATSPFRKLWRELVSSVHDSAGGFYNLSDNEKLYFAVGVLDGEIYNGGFVQFFDNSSGEYYRYCELGLIRIGAKCTVEILRKAKLLVFGDSNVPKEQEKRWPYTNNDKVEKELDMLDTAYTECDENIGQLLEVFAEETGLV